MKMALQGNTLLIKDADNVQFTVIKSWNKMKWDKKSATLRGTADLELLDKLAGMVRLPPAIEYRRTRLHAIQDAVDRERINQEPQPFYKYGKQHTPPTAGARSRTSSERRQSASGECRSRTAKPWS